MSLPDSLYPTSPSAVLTNDTALPEPPPEPPMIAEPFLRPQRLHSALLLISRSKWYTPFSIWMAPPRSLTV